MQNRHKGLSPLSRSAHRISCGRAGATRGEFGRQARLERAKRGSALIGPRDWLPYPKTGIHGFIAAGTQMLESAKPQTDRNWFAEESCVDSSKSLGFRHDPGGVHLSKTMMLDDLAKVLQGSDPANSEVAARSILEDNVLAKPTGSARKLALARLNTLYGVVEPLPVQSAMLRLWPRSSAGHALLALPCALAREPLLRDCAAVVLAAPEGTALRWPDLAAALAQRHPGRYSPKMLKSLAQNCASSWTQSGHLRGKVAKRRSRAVPSAEAAAYAALLGSLAGFGGPALLASPWMQVLDRPEPEVISLLRRAEAQGLLHLRVGGGVIQIDVRRTMAQLTGVTALADG